MQTRSEAIDVFLASAGWPGARRVPLAGDASFRRYERVFLEDRQAVLMDAPPGKEDIKPFTHIGAHLVGLGLSAPRIYAQDAINGFVLLEDLGDDLFARVLVKSPEKEEELYRAAADALICLHRERQDTSALSIPVYDTQRFMAQVSLVPEWFLPLFITQHGECEKYAAQYLDIWRCAIAQLPDHGHVPVLYDYHAENLLWLPQREAVARAGLLDFQDAVWGSPAYDLVSLIEDARRDVTEDVGRHTLDYYLENTALPREEFMTAYALLGAQRNCRIVGTFARLARRDGKYNYLSYLPRVWRHLTTDLSHPLLADLRRWVDDVVPQEWRGAIDPALMRKQAAG